MSVRPWQIALALFLFTVLTVFASNLAFHDLRQAVIAGILVGILGALFEVRLAIERNAETATLTSRQATERLIKYLRIADAYSDNDWIIEILSSVLSLKPAAERNNHTRARCEAVLRAAIDQASRDVGSFFRVETGSNELERILRLREVVANARDYVWAVSFDVDDYLNRFCSQVFGSEYVRANVETATRGVVVKRIFVVSRDTLSGNSREKHEKLKAIVKSLRKAGGKNINSYVVALEDLPDALAGVTTSFLVCDDYVASESNGTAAGAAVTGYVSYGEFESAVRPLRKRFEQLQLHASEHFVG